VARRDAPRRGQLRVPLGVPSSKEVQPTVGGLRAPRAPSNTDHRIALARRDESHAIVGKKTSLAIGPIGPRDGHPCR
jgi:hypothetical protein